MNDKMEEIRRAIRDGKLTAGDAQKALQDEIERELNQKPENIDMDVVNACEALLTELSGADEALHTEENRFAIRRQMRAAEKTPRRRPKAAAIAAALAAAVLAFGGTATVLGLAGNDHTRRLEELQENRQVEAADMMSAARLTLSISPETLTLNGGGSYLRLSKNGVEHGSSGEFIMKTSDYLVPGSGANLPNETPNFSLTDITQESKISSKSFND